MNLEESVRKNRGRLGQVKKCGFQSSLGLVTGHQAVVAKKIHNNKRFIWSFCVVFYSWCEYDRPFQVVDIMESLQKELAKIQVTAPDINSIP